MNLHKILAENMLRFGPKNLSESDKEYIKQISEADEKKVSIVFASTSAEKMPNSTNVELNGLPTPDATTYPDIEKVVFTATVSQWLASSKGNLLKAFTPVRTTATAMDVLKVGSLGGDYTQGAVTPSGGIQFMSDSTDTIEASHNGLLVLARALETWIDAGKPAGIKFMLKMGQANRWGAYINLSRLFLLNNSAAGWESEVIATLIPDGQFSGNDYASYDGKTAEERGALFNTSYPAGMVTTALKTQFPFTATTTGPAGVDVPAFIKKYFGQITKLEDFGTNTELKTDYESMFNATRNHFVKAIKNDFYANLVNKTGIKIPEMEDIITNISAMTASNPKTKATPIMTSAASYGKSTSTPAKASAGTYQLGTGKN